MSIVRSLRIRAANLVGPLFINSVTGRVIAAAFGDRIPYRGLRIDTSSPLIRNNTKASLFWRSYERAEYAFAVRYLPADCDVVEFGGSIGVLTNAIAKHTSGTVTVVEADPRLVKIMQRNLELNGTSNVRILNAAVAYEGDTVTFGIGDSNISGRVGVAAQTVEVPATNLAAIAPAPGFALICDIEGAEWEMLDREIDIVKRASVVVMETHVSFGGEAWTRLVERIRGEFDIVDQYGPVIVFRPKRSR